MSQTTLDRDAQTVMRVPVSGGRHFALVDAADYERVSEHTWSLGRSGNRRTLYAQRRVNGTTQMMHNFITGAVQIDHINHDGLDNRRENLRDGSGVRNARNTRKADTSNRKSSAYKGVSWRKPDSSHGAGWEAHIRVDGKQKYLGKFPNEAEAARIYDYAALRYYGEFASLNFPDDPKRVIGNRADGRPIYAIAGGSGAPEPVNPPAADPPAPERPDGVTEEEWAALGDPGRAAIVREREARQAAERALAASRARPAPPKADPPKVDPPKADPPKADEPPDFAALIKQAVDAAVKPFVEREEQRDAQTAANKVQTSVAAAAKSLLHDETDALTNIDLTTIVNDQGHVDADKLKTALDDLVKRKPHLAKPEAQRIAPPGIGGGGAPAGTSEGDKVRGLLAQMQQSAGIRPPSATTS